MIRFLIISPVIHKKDNKGFAAYTPYVREMNIWLKYVDHVRVIAPLSEKDPDPLETYYHHDSLSFCSVPAINFTRVGSLLYSLFVLPLVMLRIIRGMIWANHIHLRCPSNMGLLGVIAQIFFPHKIKTVKYANNWDPGSRQAATYRFQQHLLRNGFLTRKASVLVYGDWKEKSPNIVPFFTASYPRSKALPVDIRRIGPGKKEPLNLIFVGTLTGNKRPLECIKVLQILKDRGYLVKLDMFGDGAQRPMLEAYIAEYGLGNEVKLWGRQSPDTVESFFMKAHFLVFLSYSEGWPKVVAESMWWGCMPLTTDVSCVSQMLGGGARGVIVEPDASKVADVIEQFVSAPDTYTKACQAAMDWSRQYDLEHFEEEIVKLIEV